MGRNEEMLHRRFARQNLLVRRHGTRLCRCFKQVDGVWYIVNFQSIYEKDTIIPVFPDGGFTIPTEEIEKYRPSYAGIIYLTKQKGGTVNEELAGIDRPDLVEKIYNETDKWLQGE